MTIIHGQIEPLKKIKKELSENNISRFSSIADINKFTQGYELELASIDKDITSNLDRELIELKSDHLRYKELHSKNKADAVKTLINEVKSKEISLAQIEAKRKKSLLARITLFFRLRNLKRSKNKLEKNFGQLLKKRTGHSGVQVTRTSEKIEEIINNREVIIEKRTSKAVRDLKNTKSVIDRLYPLIAGAIGENSVVNTIKKLPDNYYLINDFSKNFDPPIYNKKDNDRIFSIQIDHLLIAPSGLYIIETKNWSKQSTDSYDLRSPVKQVLRTSYALFVYLNSDANKRLGLKKHHWGRKKIPIRNLIVMTNHKPNEEFQHVKVLSLNNLNGYIKYFESVFSNEDTRGIYEYLAN